MNVWRWTMGIGIAGMMGMIQGNAQDLASVLRPGAHIQRTMSLLAKSSPEIHPNVRILFYGQSITCQPWWRLVADDLRRRFPNTVLQIENHGIGGFTAPDLICTTEYDLYPYYPDLLIFHVYGGGDMKKFEGIIQGARSRTAAEILLWTHHDAGRPGDYKESERIREIAVKYNCGLVDVLAQWQALLKERGLEPKALLKDSVHLNEEGCGILAGMISPFLVESPALLTAESRSLVTDILPDDPDRVKSLPDGSIEVSFSGNRIDAIALPATGQDVLADVLLDGKHPSETEGVFALTRPSTAPHTWFPAVKVIQHQAPLVAEDWLLTFTECSADAKAFRFRVAGSVTGEDGGGSNSETFVSKSGRVVIDGGNNWQRVPWSLQYTKKEMPAEFRVKWRVYPMFVDKLCFAAAPEPGKERTVTLAQGFVNGEHTIRLIPGSGQKLLLKGFRVYTPPLPVSAEGSK